MHPYLNRDFVLQRPKFILFGDSLTERGFAPGGWAARLAHHFYRKVDVLNRGLGGYNSRWAVQLAGDVLADVDGTNTQLVTIFFGANDAARPDGPPQSAKQHVPVNEYKENLKKIVKAVQAKGVKRIVLLSPPPVHDVGRKEWQVTKVGAAEAAKLPLDRTNSFTAQYAEAACQAARDLSLPCVDLYRIVQQQKGWERALFNDGLHFTPDGNLLLADAVIATLAEAWPDFTPDSLPLHFPNWDHIDAAKPANTFDAFAALREKGPHAVGTVPEPGAAPAAGASKPAADKKLDTDKP